MGNMCCVRAAGGVDICCPALGVGDAPLLRRSGTIRASVAGRGGNVPAIVGSGDGGGAVWARAEQQGHAGLTVLLCIARLIRHNSRAPALQEHESSHRYFYQLVTDLNCCENCKS